MKKHWVDKDVDVDTLARYISDFFQKRKIDAESLQSSGGVTILAKSSNTKDAFFVKVYSKDNDLDVEFVEKETRFSKFLGNLAGVFGGGVLVLRSTKSEEFSEKLQRDFWVFLEEIVDALSCTKKSRLSSFSQSGV